MTCGVLLRGQDNGAGDGLVGAVTHPQNVKDLKRVEAALLK